MALVFASGDLALDVIGTLSERRKTRVENLRSGDDVARWLTEAGVLDVAPRTDEETLRDGLALRPALFAIVERLIDGPGPPLPSSPSRC